MLAVNIIGKEASVVLGELIKENDSLTDLNLRRIISVKRVACEEAEVTINMSRLQFGTVWSDTIV